MNAGEYQNFFHELASGPWADPAAPGRRMAESLRRLSRVALAIDGADAETLAERLDEIASSVVEPAPDHSRYAPEDIGLVDGHLVIKPNSRGTHPLMGIASPIAPPLSIGHTDERVYAEVTYDARHEGLPGKVQGGFLAAAFDLLLGQGVALGGGRGVTASLTVRYRITTPIGRPLRYESWYVGGEGRKSTAKARLVDGADAIGAPDDQCTVYCEAEGLFITPRPIGTATTQERSR